MKHAGKARQAAFRIITASLVILFAVVAGGFVAHFLGNIIIAAASSLFFVWIIFALFTFYFFRDPDAKVPAGKNLILAPGHGTVDLIDEAVIADYDGAPCKRISIFLNVFNVHVQNAPVTGKVIHLKHKPGLFLNAIKADCALHNENVLIHFQPAENPSEKIAIRLISGLIARRIIPWVMVDDTVEAGQRISLIQFGSRVDVYLPKDYQVRVRNGDKTVGGETILASK